VRHHDRCSFPRKGCSAIAFLCLGSSSLLTAAAQESPKPPDPSEQSASNAPPSVIKTCRRG
jgi:hypothetical protein